MSAIDFIIPSNRNLDFIKAIFNECLQNPDIWKQHHFIVIYDTESELLQLQGWLTKNKDNGNLPQITALAARLGTERNLNALRQQGMEYGSNPYVYFQDDDDPLPSNLARHIEFMENNPESMATYGICETFDGRKSVVERFPAATGGSFFVPPLEACKYFPTYAHPLAALFRRELFHNIAIDDHRTYRAAAHASFLCALLNSEHRVDFMSDLIRRVRHHQDNDNGIFTPSKAKALSQDIMHWVTHVKDDEHAEFQKEIARRLSAGEINTFRDIAAAVEERMSF